MAFYTLSQRVWEFFIYLKGAFFGFYVVCGGLRLEEWLCKIVG